MIIKKLTAGGGNQQKGKAEEGKEGVDFDEGCSHGCRV